MYCQQCGCTEFHRQPPTSNPHHQTVFRQQFLFSLSIYSYSYRYIVIDKVERAYKTTLEGVLTVKNEHENEKINK